MQPRDYFMSRTHIISLKIISMDDFFYRNFVSDLDIFENAFSILLIYIAVGSSVIPPTNPSDKSLL